MYTVSFEEEGRMRNHFRGMEVGDSTSRVDRKVLGYSERGDARKGRRVFLPVLVALVGIGLSGDVTIAQEVSIPPPEGLIAWWPGDGNADDIVNGNHGTLMRGATFADGKVLEGIHLDGVDDFVTIPFDPVLLPSHITVDAWIKFDTVKDNLILIHKINSYGLNFGVTFANLNGQSGKFSFSIQSPGGWRTAIGTTTPVTGVFYHVTGTYDRNAVKLYVNGILEGETPNSGPIQQTNSPHSLDVYLGWVPNVVFHETFPGVIDETEIFDRALVQSEIEAIYNAGSAGKQKGGNVAPTAIAGDSQSRHAGETAFLDGSGSFDDNTATEDLQYDWSFVSVPPGSTTTISGANTPFPSFVLDLPGNYDVQLVVTDSEGLSSEPSTVTISSFNGQPNANAGLDQGTFVGDLVTLDGSASFDPDGDPIGYSWTLIEQPEGSTATLLGANSVSPSLVPDLPGAYEVQLVVNDGFAESKPDTVTVMVISVEDFASGQLTEALNRVAKLLPSRVTTKGNQTALVQFLKQAIKSVQGGNTAKAIRKIEQASSHMDGCALRGTEDTGFSTASPPPAKDYINNCFDQDLIYPLLQDALASLSG